MLTQHRESGGRLANNLETNIKLWTYAEIMEMVNYGGRMCEGMSSLFQTNDVQAYQALIASGEAEIIRRGLPEFKDFVPGSMRDGQVKTSRPSSGDFEIDADEASHIVFLRSQYCEKASRHLEELDQLADRLADAKVGVEEDFEMMGLMTGIESLEA